MSTIALVDDDRNILTSVSMTLEAEGYDVVTFNDGQSALDAFNIKLPDIAVLDIKMPRMDGMDLLSRLRQKIEPDPGSPRFLQTVRGRGYRLSLDGGG